MHLAKGVFALLFFTVNSFVVWVPMLWWLLRWPFAGPEARSRLRISMDKVIIWWTRHNR